MTAQPAPRIAFLTLLLAASWIAAPTAEAVAPLHETRLVPTDPAALDLFGSAVALEDDVLAVSSFDPASSDPFGTALVTIYRRVNHVWTEEQTLSGSYGFGDQIHLHEGRLLISSLDVPAFEIFTRGASGWSRSATLTPGWPGSARLSTGGDRLVMTRIGLQAVSPGDALAEVFRLDAGGYVHEQTIAHAGELLIAEGWFAANDDDRLVLVYGGIMPPEPPFLRSMLYERDASGSWNEARELDLPAPPTDGAFREGRLALFYGYTGQFVSLWEERGGGLQRGPRLSPPADPDREQLWAFAFDGDRVAISTCCEEREGPGVVHVWERRSWGGWVRDRVLVSRREDAGDSFGASVALDEGRIAVGVDGFPAPTGRGDPTQGAVHLFEPVPRVAGTDLLAVGTPRNPGDPRGGEGRVDVRYFMGRTEVTNAEYVAFLNAVDPAATNALGLFDPAMMNEVWGGITRDATAPAGERYRVRPFKADHPVNYVDWRDAARFANWLHHDRPTGGGTESGAYDMRRTTPVRLSGARFALPTEDEWYKAAYYEPLRPGAPRPGAGRYWSFPTRSDLAPEATVCTSSGRVTNAGANVATYDGDCIWATAVTPGFTPNTSPVAGTTSPGPFGTFDQGGNVAEWLETSFGTRRGARGGSFDLNLIPLAARPFGVSGTVFVEPSDRGANRGFRVVYLGPDPRDSFAPADLDRDGIVGPADFFGVMRPCLGAGIGERPECRIADLDGDGRVGPSDYFAVMRPALGSR